jgi:hypothetical protein
MLRRRTSNHLTTGTRVCITPPRSGQGARGRSGRRCRGGVGDFVIKALSLVRVAAAADWAGADGDSRLVVLPITQKICGAGILGLPSGHGDAEMCHRFLRPRGRGRHYGGPGDHRSRGRSCCAASSHREGIRGSGRREALRYRCAMSLGGEEQLSDTLLDLFREDQRGTVEPPPRIGRLEPDVGYASPLPDPHTSCPSQRGR